MLSSLLKDKERYLPYAKLPGQVCQVYTNLWNASACNFNYQSRQAIWNNTGDCAYLRDSAGADVEIVAPITCCADDRLTARALALQGFGAVRLIRDVIAEDLCQSRLVRLAPEYSFGFVAIRLVPSDPHPSPAVLAFLDLAEGLIS